MRVSLAGLFILTAVTLAAGQEPQTKSQPPKRIPLTLEFDLSYFENVWGMRPKEYAAELYHESERKLIGNRVLSAGRFAYVLEFTRDIDNYDLENLQKALYLPDGKLRHVFFDQDNVAINGIATFGYLIQGEVSGFKGDVIRVFVEFGQDLDIQKLDPRGILQAKKMAVRRVP